VHAIVGSPLAYSMQDFALVLGVTDVVPKNFRFFTVIQLHVSSEG